MTLLITLMIFPAIVAYIALPIALAKKEKRLIRSEYAMRTVPLFAFNYIVSWNLRTVSDPLGPDESIYTQIAALLILAVIPLQLL